MNLGRQNSHKTKFHVIDCHHFGKCLKTGFKLNSHKTKFHVNNEMDCLFGGRVAKIRVKLNLSKV
jgi:hypothetical protein